LHCVIFVHISVANKVLSLSLFQCNKLCLHRFYAEG